MQNKNSFLARKVFVNLTSLLGLRAKVTHEYKNDSIFLSIASDEPGRLIGKNGSNLNSLSLIMSRILATYQKNFPKCILNIVNQEEKSEAEIKNSLKNRRKKILKEEKNNVFNVYVEPGKVVEEVIESSSPVKLKKEKNVVKDHFERECFNSLKELKRWGEDILIPPLNEEDCKKALLYFEKHKEVSAQIDEKKSFSDRKRIRISLKK